jgi:hypothetical protein
MQNEMWSNSPGSSNIFLRLVKNPSGAAKKRERTKEASDISAASKHVTCKQTKVIFVTLIFAVVC